MKNGKNNINNNLGEHILITQAMIYANRKYYDDKTKKQDSKFDQITEMVENIMGKIQISNSLPDKIYVPKVQDPTAMVPDNNKSPPLKGTNHKKLVACGISNKRSALQNYMNSSSRYNSKTTLL